MKVKVCGITSLEDALAAIAAGADMLGFNFYPPSPRYLTPAACRRILAELASLQLAVVKVGVFVNPEPGQIRALLEQLPLDLVQFSGTEAAATVRAFSGIAYKAIRPQDAAQADGQSRDYAQSAVLPALLVDSARNGLFGGSGQTGDWGLAQALARRYPILLAGGLNPDNVSQAIHQVHPWGVDVASGIESAPGVKDPGKLVAFITAARDAAKELQSC